MMLSVVMRRVDSGGSSDSVLWKSLQTKRPAFSTNTICSNAENEILSYTRGFGSVRNFCHHISQCDLVDAVVPFMGESISDGKNPGESVKVDEPIAQVETYKVTIDIASPEACMIQKPRKGILWNQVRRLLSLKSVEGVAQVAPSEEASNLAPSQSSPPAEKISEEKQKPKDESTPVTEKPKSPSAPPSMCSAASATERQLLPRERERRNPHDYTFQ